MTDASAPAPAPQPPADQRQGDDRRQKKPGAGKRKLGILLLVALLIAAGIGVYVFLHWGEESTDDAEIDGRTVTVAPKVSGYVKTLNIDDNQVVKAGDVLLEIDPTDYINRRDKAAADLDAAEAAAEASVSNFQTTNVQAPSNIDAAQAQVDAADANWQKAVADLKRMERLGSEARSQEQLDQAIAAERAAAGNLEDAKARLRSANTAPRAIAAAKAQADQLAAQVKSAQAELAQAESDLANTKLIAPMDGRITRRQVERGDYVQPGQALASLVGTDLWVTANFKEIQLQHMRPGQRVKIDVDAYPNLDLEGKVDSIQGGSGAFFSAFPPENATGNFVKIVQRVPVKIVLDNLPDDPNIVLGPGLSVEPVVYTDSSNAGPAANPVLIAIVVSIAAFMEVLDTTITNVSLSHIAGSLAASQDESTWVLTSYLVSNGIVLPLSGWLAGVMGRKNFFMACIGGFTLASLACGLAQSLPMLIGFRLLQGLAGGGLQPTQQAIVMDSFAPEKRGTAFAITGITMIVAPVLGPTLGGFITDNYSWRWIFFMNVPIGILALVLVNRLVEDPPYAKAKGLLSIDYIGLSLVAIGLGAMQIVLDKGQEDDWFGSKFIITFATISVACLVSAVAWLLNRKDPIIDLGLLKKSSFGLACVMIFFVGFALYGATTLLPQLVQTDYGYDATLAGLVLSPGGLAIIVLMPIAGRLTNRIQARYLIAFGMFMTALGMWGASYITPQVDYRVFLLIRISQVVGLPFLFVPTGTLAFANIPREKSSKASALYSLMRNLGGSIGISILSSLVQRHQQLHQNFLSAHLTPLSAAYANMLAQSTRTIEGLGIPASAAHAAAMGRVYRQLITQSSVLAYADAFRFMSVLLLALVVVALLMPGNKLNKKPAADAAPAH